MIARLKKEPDLSLALQTAVRDIVALHGAEFGNVQLVGDDGDLWIVGHKGLSGPFFARAAHVSAGAGTVCARALRLGKTMSVANVLEDEAFRPFIDLARDAGFRAVISSPLISAAGERIGVISAHFASPKTPTDIEKSTLESYCLQLASHLLERASATSLAAMVQELQEAMLARSSLSA